jgi:Ni/Fe-hydrogenase subunit HybB-like protein
MPVVCERFIGRVSLPGPLKALNGLTETLLRVAQSTLAKIMFIFIAMGVVLSCMHQSSLGSLLLIAPYKMSPLWYTPILPLMFLLSAFAAGFAMVVFESLLASWTFGRKPEMPVLSAYSRFVAVFLGVYGLARISDLTIREAWGGAFAGNGTSFMFLAELGLGIVLPFAMLFSARLRRSPAGLLTAASLVVFGVLLNRINVFLVAYTPPYAQTAYFPSVPEILVTVGLVAGLVLAYRVCVTVFPVLPVEEHETIEAAETVRQRRPVEAESYVS